MPLNQEVTPPVDDPRRWLHLIHGEPGVGKTSWAAQIPGHYFVRTEEGCKGLYTFGEDVTTWEQFVNNIVGELVKGVETNWEGQRKVETIVIDVVEKLWEICAKWIVKNRTFLVKGTPQSFADVRHVPFGIGYTDTTAELLRVIRVIQHLGIGMVLLSHTNYRRFPWGTEELRRAEPDFTPSTVDDIVGECDAVGYFATDEVAKKELVDGVIKVVSIEKGRFQYWQPQFLRIAKHRYDLPERFPLIKYEGWKDYCAEFAKGVEKERQRLIKQ